MSIRVNLKGHRYIRLLVIRLSTVKNGRAIYECLCDCGNSVMVRAGNLRSGNSKSCGCYNLDSIKERSTTHGMSNAKTYSKWASMLTRCYNKKQDRADRYVHRGITVCERWNKFENFLIDMGECPHGMTLGRINNEGNYNPDNCRWETIKQQNNNRSTTRIYSCAGTSKSITEWAEECGMDWHTLARRLNNGWPIADAINIPVVKNGRYKFPYTLRPKAGGPRHAHI